MDPRKAIEFVSANHHAVLATSRGDGSPQLSPVLVAVDDAGRVVVSTRQTALKVKNVRRTPRAWLCVFSDAFFGQWVQLSGPVTVLDLPEAMEPLVEYYRSLSGEHPDWDEYRAAMEREQRCLLQVTVEEAGPDRAG
ncbi:MAG: PPOX class F420-dependent oxidoreductase [Actinomycetes bacterium]